MWKVIYIAPTQERAESLKKLLADNGFPAAIEISVPVSEAEEAYEVLAEHGFRP